MKRMSKRLLAFVLCLVMVFGVLGIPSAGATNASETAQPDSSKVIYANGSAATYVPAGYTYVYQSESGQTYSRTTDCDVYISQRVLTADEAAKLAALEYGEVSYVKGEDGQPLVRRDFDAKQAAEYSDVVGQILAGTPVAEGDKVSVVSELYGKATPVKALITFEEAPVSKLDGMSVSLGTPLGAAEQQAMASLRAKQKTAAASIGKKLGYSVAISGQFTLLTNAISATVNYGDLAKISAMDGVKSAIVMPSFTMPEVNFQTVDADSQQISTNLKYVSTGMGAAQAWDCGYQGEGMTIAVIDTGLCYMNSSFSTEPTDPEAVAFSKDDISKILLTKELHAEALSDETSVDTVYYSSKIPFGFNYADGAADFGSDDSTMFGHGTHVAGIVAGNLTEEKQQEFDMQSMGIAPEAQLIIMKVFDSKGNCYFDYILAAMEDAIVLGVDCANLSLGSPSGPYYYEDITEVYDAAYAAGINVVASAGNDASSADGSLWGGGLLKSSTVSSGTVGMPGSFDSVLTVASAENGADISFIGNGISWFNDMIDSRQYVSYEEVPDAPEGMGFKERLQGQSFEFTDSFNDAEGKLVFLDFAGGDADPIIDMAVETKAAGVVLCLPEIKYDDNGEPLNEPAEYTLTKFDVPVAISDDNQHAWMLRQRPAEGLVRVDAFWNPSSTAGQMSDFSSWGPTDGLTLKPEITGIGGGVFSAYYFDSFAVASGTSMSSPAVAASAALVRQYLKTTGMDEAEIAHAVNCLLMSTATPIFDEEHDTYYFVRRQGAGMANAGNAIASEAYIQVEGTNKAKLELGDDPEKTGVYEMSFEVVNFSDTDKVYTLDTIVLGQIAEGGQIRDGKVTYLVYDYAKELQAEVTSSLSDNTVTVPAGGTAEVTVTVSLTDAAKAYYDERFPCGAYVEGFIRLLSDDTPNLTVPFLAFYGDYGAAPIMDDQSYVGLLGGKKGYNAADQFQSAIWSTYVKPSTIPDVEGTTTEVYLGDTRNEGYDKVLLKDFDFETMQYAYTPFFSEHAGISPNNDGMWDELYMGLGLNRNAENIHYTVTDLGTGEVLWEQDTGFVNKTYSAATYAGSGMEALSMEWLYELVVIEYPWGDVYAYYDMENCLLEENTLVSIEAEVTPEYPGAAVQTQTYTLYIDCSGPIAPDGLTLSTEEEDPIDFGDFIIPGTTMYLFKTVSDEYWYRDYDLELTLDYSEEEDRWYGFVSTSTYFMDERPVRDDGGWTEVGISNFETNSKYVFFAYDYAGNVSAFEILGGEHLTENISLTADKTTIMVGETLTVTDVGEAPYNNVLTWKSSDESVVRIVESADHSAVIEGVSRGDATVTAGFGDFVATIDIHVTDEEFEALKTRFTDISGHWAEDVILEAVYAGLFNGDGKDTFGPDKPITRAQAITVLYRMEGEPEVAASSVFTDVPETQYYAKAVAWAAENGIVNGATPSTFEPDEMITREQLAAILFRYAGYKELDLTAEADLSAYEDADTISSYAKDAFVWAVANGLINGDSETTLSPQGTATRAEAAALLVRFQAFLSMN